MKRANIRFYFERCYHTTSIVRTKRENVKILTLLLWSAKLYFIFFARLYLMQLVVIVMSNKTYKKN